MPNSASNSDVLPAPMSPNRPTISPAPTTRSSGGRVGRVWAPRMTRTGAADGAAAAAGVAGDATPGERVSGEASAVPRIAAPISRADVVSANSRTRRPSRMTPTRAASPATSGRRWDTYSTPTPSPIIRLIVANRRSVSRSESAEVGSSRTRRRGSWARARARTICWRSLEPRRSTTASSGRSRPARSAISRARVRDVVPPVQRPAPVAPEEVEGEVLPDRVAGQDPGVDLLVDRHDPRAERGAGAAERER